MTSLVLARFFQSCRETFLTPEGDVGALAHRAIQILQSSPQHYAELSAQCVALSGKYRWSEIAEETARKYRTAFDRLSDVVVFTQPFSLVSAGGGPRILRSLLKDAPVPTLAVCTAPPSQCHDSELQVPLRPNFGRIERTRFNGLAHSDYSAISRRLLGDWKKSSQMRARAPFTRLRTAAWIFIPRFFWRKNCRSLFSFRCTMTLLTRARDVSRLNV